jgi:hypothetical protein
LASAAPIRRRCAGAARSSQGLFYGWFVVAAAFAITFVGFRCTYSFSAFIESLQRDFGASRGSVSVVFALAARRRARGHGKKDPGGA